MRWSTFRSSLGFVLALCWVLAFVGGCRSERRATPLSASSASSSVTTTSASTSGRLLLPSPSARTLADGEPARLDEARARRFVELWAETQNAHDFSAYSALYAERFTGLKRVGSYSRRFDRRGWLRDRQPMFREGVSVQLAELQISLAPGASRAVFTQDFSAPGFHDTGKKQLFLLALGQNIVISREEMLVSRVTASVAHGASTVLAFHRDGAVLDSSARVDASKSQPRLLSHAAGDAYDVAITLAPSDVSEATRSWLGRAVTVYAKDGAKCGGVVARFELRVTAVPHFGMVQAWNGESDQPKASATQIAAEIWRIARDEERFVVGVLDHDCHGLWATERPATWAPAKPAGPALRAATIAAFKALPRYRELQAAFAAETADSTHAWEEVDGELTVVEVRSPSQPALVIASAHGGAGCASFSGNLSAIWKVAKGGALGLGQVLETGDLLRAHGAVEIADGGLELLAGPDGLANEVSVLLPTAGGYERHVLLLTSFWDCGC